MQYTFEDIQYSYLAGYIDGDGCFYIDTVKAKTGKYPIVHRTVVKFASVDEEIMIWLKEKLHITYWKKIVSKKRKNFNRRDVFEANVTGQTLDNLLPKIYPFLKIKKRHCKIMMKMRSTYEKPKKGVIRKQLTKEIFDFRCQCHQELSSINTHKRLNPSPVSPSP